MRSGDIFPQHKLLPCPCCGSSDIYLGVAHAFGYNVRCNGCGMRTRCFDLPEYCTKRNLDLRIMWKAMCAWNRRVTV